MATKKHKRHKADGTERRSVPSRSEISSIEREKPPEFLGEPGSSCFFSRESSLLGQSLSNFTQNIFLPPASLRRIFAMGLDFPWRILLPTWGKLLLPWQKMLLPWGKLLSIAGKRSVFWGFGSVEREIGQLGGSLRLQPDRQAGHCLLLVIVERNGQLQRGTGGTARQGRNQRWSAFSERARRRGPAAKSRSDKIAFGERDPPARRILAREQDFERL